jgi:hypothetical protein
MKKSLKKKYRVIVVRSERKCIEVEAKNESQARKLAESKAANECMGWEAHRIEKVA